MGVYEQMKSKQYLALDYYSLMSVNKLKEILKYLLSLFMKCIGQLVYEDPIVTPFHNRDILKMWLWELLHVPKNGPWKLGSLGRCFFNFVFLLLKTFVLCSLS